MTASQLETRGGNAVSKLSLSLIGTLSLGLLALSARAQDKPAPAPTPPAPGSAAPSAPDTRPRWVVACQGDIQKHCLEQAKTGDARPCLADHEKDLTQACKDAFIRQYKIVQLCKDDIEKLCADSGGDGRAIAKCFNEKQDQLSPKCKSALSKGSREHDKAEAKSEAAAKTEAAPEEPAPKKKKAAKVTGKPAAK
jgi:hypothetical protein